MTIVVYLRDLTRSEAKFLVEVKKESEEYIDSEERTKMFKEFIEKAKAQLPLKSKKVDVWIGVWIDESQFTIEFPPEFMKLVGENGWEVTFDLND